MLARINASLEKKYLYDQLREEREKSEALLLNILPEPIAERLKAGEKIIADGFHDVSVLFADIVNFTPLAATVDPDDLILLLNDIFSRFDKIADRYGLEKIKTIGDSYLVVGGLLREVSDHPGAIARMALDMMDAIEDINESTGFDLALRIGIHVGPVVAGVVGTTKFFYDLWGNTVNIANRMETYGEVGQIHITNDLAGRLKGQFELEERDPLNVKGIGEMQTYFLVGSGSQVSSN
jgi:adenylate cyclase